MKQKTLLLLISILLWLGCSSKELSPKGYLQWLQNNQSTLLWSVEQKDFAFELKYLPHDWMILRDAGTNLTKQNYLTLTKEYEGLEYYKLQITGNANLLDTKIGQLTNYQDRLNYCAFEMQKDIKLVIEKDTLNCQLFHFERTFKTSPSASFMLGFDKPNIGGSHRKILLTAKEIGFTPLSWTIPNEVIQNIPKLKL